MAKQPELGRAFVFVPLTEDGAPAVSLQFLHQKYSSVSQYVQGSGSYSLMSGSYDAEVNCMRNVRDVILVAHQTHQLKFSVRKNEQYTLDCSVSAEGISQFTFSRRLTTQSR